LAGNPALVIMTAPQHPDATAGDTMLAAFQAWLKNLPAPRILELGTLPSTPGRSTIHRDWAPHGQWTGSDFIAGDDVDIVADAHELAVVMGTDRFDAVVACSVFEHLQRPWIAAAEIASVLKPSGQVYVQTHFAFPIHGYPQDYFRFTREALHTIFADAGLEVIGTSYAFPARIESQQAPETRDFPAFLNSNVMARKPG
jgi:SAM-dependent methyltransferase